MKGLGRFFLIFLAVYLALVLLHFWPPVQQLHLRFFMSLEQTIFNLFHTHVHTHFIPFIADPDVPQTEDFHFSIEIYDQLNWNQRYQTKILPNYQLNQNIKVASIFHVLFFVALMAATPISWRRRLAGISLGLVIIYLLIAMKFTHLIGEKAEFMQNRSWTLWQTISDLIGPAMRTHEFLLMSILCIWVFVSFRVADFKKLIS